jgi:branched-chain amino acid transport system ATP-binding protein
MIGFINNISTGVPASVGVNGAGIVSSAICRVVDERPSRILGQSDVQRETGTDNGAPILAVDDVTLAFGGVKALTGVGFEVKAGTITAVIGPNGAGKTSLFNTISGFYRPSHGCIRFRGEDITRLPAPQRAKLGLARSFQNIALFRGMTVLDNIKLGRHAHLRTNVFDALFYVGRARREEAELRRDIEERIIDFLEIDHIRHASVAALPYGLQKRVEMARALAMQPQVLMLDEPVAGMNREETEDMARFILDVRTDWGVTVLMVEHDMGMVMDLSDHVVVLNFGQVIAQGAPAAVQTDPEVIRAYLGAGDVGQLRRRLSGEGAQAS